MTEPIGLAETASKSIEESVQDEHDVVGEHPDTGDLVSPDDAQSAPPAQ